MMIFGLLLFIWEHFESLNNKTTRQITNDEVRIFTMENILQR